MRTNRLHVLVSRETESVLRLLGERVSRLWNVGNYHARQAFLAGQRVPSYEQLWTELKLHDAYRALPSDIAQEVLKKLSEAWRGYFTKRKRWKAGSLRDKPGLVGYRKNRSGAHLSDLIPIKCKRAYAVHAHHLALTLPADLRASFGRLVLPYRGLRRYHGKHGRAELAFDQGLGRWYFRYAVNQADNALKPWTRSAALDLGVRIAASLSIEGKAQALHFLGRDLLKDWDYWGRRIAKHNAELSHRPKEQRSSKQLRRLYQRRNSHWASAWEALAAHLVRELKRHHVGTLYVGPPEGIRRDRYYGRTWNDRIHGFWGFYKAIQILEKHCNRAGILLERVNERGSSSTCPACSSRNVRRHPRHALLCRDCGFLIYADQAGSRNILRFQRPDVSFNETRSDRDGAETAPRPDTRWWNRHRWVDASNPLIRERLAA